MFNLNRKKKEKKIPAWKVDDECVDNNVIEEPHFLRSRENVLWLLDSRYDHIIPSFRRHREVKKGLAAKSGHTASNCPRNATFCYENNCQNRLQLYLQFYCTVYWTFGSEGGRNHPFL